MFSSSKNQTTEIINSENEKTLDSLTIWLIRIACIMLIVFFSSLLVSIPILISFSKTQLNNSLLSFKEILKTFLDNQII